MQPDCPRGRQVVSEAVQARRMEHGDERTTEQRRPEKEGEGRGDCERSGRYVCRPGKLGGCREQPDEQSRDEATDGAGA